MRILFTGGSSFTGYWFVNELARAGHEVVATFRGPEESYEGIRRERVERLEPHCRRFFGCSFGDSRFLDLVGTGGGWDVLCQHAAQVADYKSPDFDVLGAVVSNTKGLPSVLEALRGQGCGSVVLTGSVFENDEGAGSDELPAFSPYGLSKGLTAQVFRYRTAACGMRLGKFVIPNPFGPFEEPRFTFYLLRSWFRGETPRVDTPAYVRDNIHVSLLAKAYVDFLERLVAGAAPMKINPSGYVESQGAFAKRLAGEMRTRLGLACQLELREQIDFPEPRSRFNTDIPDARALGWDERRAWDEFAEYYRSRFG
jgi:nucleoside-diphosphate-sugar epimerase